MLSDVLPGLRWKDWSFVPSSAPAQRRNELGLTVLLFGYMGFTFASAVLLFLITASRHSGRTEETVPAAFWWSTGFVLAGGWCLRRAVRAVKRERQALARRCVAVAVICGAAFAGLQAWGSAELIDGYHAAALPTIPQTDGSRLPDLDAPSRTPLTGVAIVLVTIHGLHFVGGLIVLALAAARTFAGRYDHEYHGGLKLSARYWTFLDVAWLAMLAAIWWSL